jgi:hypothetical protein
LIDGNESVLLADNLMWISDVINEIKQKKTHGLEKI